MRTESAAAPLVVAGNGTGLVNAASVGLLDGNPTVLYAASLAQDPAAFDRAMGAGAGLVLTDTNQLQGERWGGVTNNVGLVQQPGVPPTLMNDPSDYVNPLFKGETTADQTVASVSGVKSVRATGYGSAVDYTPENQPGNALDGDPSTAWEVQPAGNADGYRLQVALDKPVTTNHITLSQVQALNVKRTITSVTLLFDGKHPTKVNLGHDSLQSSGQVATFPTRTFSSLDVVIDSTTGGAHQRFDGLNAVGLSEVGIPGVAPLTTTLRMPTDLLSQAGGASQSHALTILMNRLRAPNVPRADPETHLSRQFSLPSSRTFLLGGTARISYKESDAQIENLTGVFANPAASATGAVPIVGANSSGRLIGDLQSGALAAVDGNPATAWVTEQGDQDGSWLSYTLQRPATFDHLNLQVVNDGRHTLPTQVTVSTEDGSRTVPLPALRVGAGRPQGSVTDVPISFPALTGSQVKVTFDKTKPVSDLDYYAQFTNATDILPLGIAEVGIPGVVAPQEQAQIPAPCRSDLLTIDGHPVDLSISGSPATALANGALTVRPCGNSVGGVTLGPGSHVVQTSTYLASGFNVDSLSLASAAGGSAVRLTPSGALPTVATGPAPSVRVTHQDSTHVTATVAPTTQPVWLILGQSKSDGWHATLSSGRSLGSPTLIDGYANGWYLPAGSITAGTVVHLAWTPQRVVWAAIGVSGVAALVSVVLAVVGVPEAARPRRRAPEPAEGQEPRPALAALGPAVPAWDSPLRSGGKRPTRKTALAVAVGCGLVAALVSSPLVGLVIAVTSFVGVAADRGRIVTRLGAGLAVGILGVSMVSAAGLVPVLPDHPVAQRVHRRQRPGMARRYHAGRGRRRRGGPLSA